MIDPLPLTLDPPATTVEDLEATFVHIDARRLEWLSQRLRLADMPHAAERAHEWAREAHARAKRLRADSVARAGS